MGQQLQFPVIVTYKYACDIRVIRMLRQRGSGNSTTQIARKLNEQHGEVWMKNTIHYLTDAKEFVDANASGLITKPNFDKPPMMTPVPKYQWLLHIYGRDVMTRIDQVKASITSIFGEVLKMDSTKKVNRYWEEMLKLKIYCRQPVCMFKIDSVLNRPNFVVSGREKVGRKGCWYGDLVFQCWKSIRPSIDECADRK
jgi:hypothetical protein